MISGFGVRGFKSLVDFSIEDMGGFTCFVGLNGAGKSSILQFLDFASHLMKGDIPQWSVSYTHLTLPTSDLV